MEVRQHQVMGKAYPLVICCIAMENKPFIVDLPIEHGDFLYNIVMLVYQRRNRMLGSHMGYPLVICYITVENGTVIAELSIKNGDFP